MYQRIMVPVDLAHLDRLDKALTTASDIAKHHGAPVSYVGITSSQPSAVAHTPEEFEDKLIAFAQDQAARHGLETSAKAYVTHDPAVDLDQTLLHAISDTGADLVVMASHVPGLIEHIFASNAGYVASHATVSVFVIR
ncbi:MAG: universal stress protein [Pseudomonadota bacterium]